jgi:hypothetical protein
MKFMQFQILICMHHMLLYSEYGFQTKVQLLFCNFMAGDGKSSGISFTYCPTTVLLTLPRKHGCTDTPNVISMVLPEGHK